MKREISQHNHKRASAPNLTLSPDASAMPLDDSLAYCKPESAPANLAGQSGEGTIGGHVVLRKIIRTARVMGKEGFGTILPDRPAQPPHNHILQSHPAILQNALKHPLLLHCLRSLALQKQWLSRLLDERMYHYVYILVS